MKPRLCHRNAVWGVVLVMGAWLLAGCVGVVPIPASNTQVEHGARLSAQDVTFIQPGLTTRAEVLARLGEGCISLPWDRAIAYSWEMKGGGGFWWVVAASYTGGGADAGSWTGGWRALFIAFDDQGKVTEFAFKRPSTGRPLHEHLEAWADKTSKRDGRGRTRRAAHNALTASN